MNDHVHVSLVFSRSGQKLSVRLPRDVAQAAQSLSAKHLAHLIEQAQQINASGNPEAVYLSR